MRGTRQNRLVLSFSVLFIFSSGSVNGNAVGVPVNLIDELWKVGKTIEKTGSQGAKAARILPKIADRHSKAVYFEVDNAILKFSQQGINDGGLVEAKTMQSALSYLAENHPDTAIYLDPDLIERFRINRLNFEGLGDVYIASDPEKSFLPLKRFHGPRGERADVLDLDDGVSARVFPEQDCDLVEHLTTLMDIKDLFERAKPEKLNKAGIQSSATPVNEAKNKETYEQFFDELTSKGLDLVSKQCMKNGTSELTFSIYKTEELSFGSHAFKTVTYVNEVSMKLEKASPWKCLNLVLAGIVAFALLVRTNAHAGRS